MELFKLEALVNELTKETPDESLIKSHMEDCGLKYDEDPLKRINYVLKKMEFTDGANKDQQ